MKPDLPGRPRLVLTAAVVVALGAGVTTAALLVGASDGDDRPGRKHAISLVSYDTCDTALAEMKARIMPHVTPYGLDGGVQIMEDGDVVAAEGAGSGERAAVPNAAPAEDSAAPKQAEEGQDHSTTNVHEAGVDEPDLVKTDGKRVVSVADGVLRVVDVASREQTAVVPLEGGYATQLLIAGDRALVLSGGGGGMASDRAEPAPRIAPKPAPTDTFTYDSTLALIDLTGTGKVVSTLAVDGSYLDARQVGGIARVVVRSAPRLEFTYPEYNSNPASAMLTNKDVVARSTVGDWLPRYRLENGAGTTTGLLTDCADVSHPVDYTATAMLTVLTFDLGKELGTGDAVAIVADGNTVYGTGTSLYVADDHVAHGMVEGPAGGGRTELYQFDISGSGKPAHVASGTVDGSLLNQYSLSEHEGNLRVATTTADKGSTQSMITVLRRNGNALNQVGRVEGLGVGERIYSVRYFGNTAYVVTFRQTDPLYTVDLSDPAAPKVTGELKITGYSAYLHPAGEGRLIGVGQEADQNGRVTGAQISLFDTTNPAGAHRLAQYHLANAWTEVEGDPHAFLYWPDKGLVVLPVTGGGVAVPDGPPDQLVAGALVLKVDGNTFREAGTLTHASDRYGNTPMAPRRAIVIGDELWTVSEAGMLVSDLDSLGQLAWLPFT